MQELDLHFFDKYLFASRWGVFPFFNDYKSDYSIDWKNNILYSVVMLT